MKIMILLKFIRSISTWFYYSSNKVLYYSRLLTNNGCLLNRKAHSNKNIALFPVGVLAPRRSKNLNLRIKRFVFVDAIKIKIKFDNVQIYLCMAVMRIFYHS